jgi:hypothetical protein
MSARRNQRRRGPGVGEDAPKLLAGAEVELPGCLVQVVLDCARPDVQPCADLRGCARRGPAARGPQRLGTETHHGAQTHGKRTQLANIARTTVDDAKPPHAGLSRLLEGFRPTTENRGVPGSSPGLAIGSALNPAWLLDSLFGGVMDGELVSLAHETLVVPPDRVTAAFAPETPANTAVVVAGQADEPYRSKRPIGLFRPSASFEVLRRSESRRSVIRARARPQGRYPQRHC